MVPNPESHRGFLPSAAFCARLQGRGSSLPLTVPLEQLPGLAPLASRPLLTRFSGGAEVFMHSKFRGIPLRPSAAKVANDINRVRSYLETNIAALS